jgi:broad specificity phosphatase PhoE
MRLPFDGAIRRRVYLMRHGDVAYFDAAGNRVADPRQVVLTAQGRQEALAMRDLLQNVPFDRAIDTGLPRTIETAAITLGGRTLRVETWADLEEIRGGTAEQRAQMTPSEYAYAMFATAERDATYARGEIIAAFYRRVTGAWTKILSRPDWTTMLIAAHGGVNRAILSAVVGGGLSGFGSFEQDTGCLNVIDVDASPDGQVLRQIVRAVNVTPEDPVKISRPLTTMENLALRAFPHLRAPV